MCVCMERNNRLVYQAFPSFLNSQSPILFGDFMNPNADTKLYEEIADHPKMKRIVEESLDDYNQVRVELSYVG